MRSCLKKAAFTRDYIAQARIACAFFFMHTGAQMKYVSRS